MSSNEQSGGFWRTLPGVLSAIAALVTALTGLVIGLNQIGLFGSDDTPTSNVSVTASSEEALPDTATANAVAGTWSGTINPGDDDEFGLQVNIARNCGLKDTCGSIRVPTPCFGDLSFARVVGDTYEFSVDHFDASSSKKCTPGAGEFFEPRGDDTLLYTTDYSHARGVLRPLR